MRGIGREKERKVERVLYELESLCKAWVNSHYSTQLHDARKAAILTLCTVAMFV